MKDLFDIDLKEEMSKEVNFEEKARLLTFD